MLPAVGLVELPCPPPRRVRTVGTGMACGPVGPTGPVGPSAYPLGVAGPAGSAVGVTGVVVSTVGSGPVGPTGSYGGGLAGAVGATGPVGPSGPLLSRPAEARVVARYSGPPKEVLSSILRALSHLGHAWQVVGPCAVCDRCLSSVQVDPCRPKPGFRTTSREVGVRTVAVADDGSPVTLPRYARRLRSARLPKAAHLRQAAASFPTCQRARELLVDRVHDM